MNIFNEEESVIMTSKKIIINISIALAVSVFAVCFYYLIPQYIYIYNVNQNLLFNWRERLNTYDYAQALIDGELDLSELPTASSNVESPFLLSESAPDMEKIKISFDLEYYENIGDKEPVLVVEKGTDVYTNMDGEYAYIYGMYTFPTNDKDWRIAIPYTENGELDPENLLYLRYDDAVKLVGNYMNEYYLGEALDYYGITYLFEDYSFLTTTTNILFASDVSLRDSGIFLSPNLEISGISYFLYPLNYIFTVAIVSLLITVGLIIVLQTKLCHKAYLVKHLLMLKKEKTHHQ